ncbi:MAG: hypothetical protein J5794_09410 [Lachnospiraceae bacterium]|nr:hypothetical protein [Lachnospiraceae bacterium]
MKLYSGFGVVMITFLIAAQLFHIVKPDETYSAEEKRNLASVPELSLDTLSDGSFMSHMESYTADQFPFRSFWMRTRMNALYTVGRRESHGVTYNSDGSLSEPYQGYDEGLLRETAGALNDFASRHEFEHAWFLAVPTASEIFPEVLPPYTENASEADYFASLQANIGNDFTVFDVFQTLKDLKKDGMLLYYRTDHHWTTDTAFSVFSSLAEETGWTVGTYLPKVIDNRFLGSLSAKSGFTVDQADAVTIYLNENDSLYTLVSPEGGGSVTGSFYDYEAMRSTGDAYSVFFGGNKPVIRVRTTADTEKTLLVFKDSYANCFLPFLAESYKEITIVDPRYYSGRADDLFLQKGFTDLLCLYNIATLSADTDLKAVLSDEAL